MEADEDMDGKISFEEFQKMVENTVSKEDGFLRFGSSTIQDLFLTKFSGCLYEHDTRPILERWAYAMIGRLYLIYYRILLLHVLEDIAG